MTGMAVNIAFSGGGLRSLRIDGQCNPALNADSPNAIAVASIPEHQEPECAAVTGAVQTSLPGTSSST
jgi:hypothetical protein